MFNICPLNALLNINMQLDMNFIFKTKTKI